MPLLKKTGQTKMKLIDKIKSNNKSRKISFVSYITAGDPDINTSLNIMKNLAENGTDIMNLVFLFQIRYLMVLLYKKPLKGL